MAKEKDAVRDEMPVAAPVPKDPAYTKRAIMACPRFRHCRDLLGVLLNDSKAYTLDEAERLVNNYKKGKVR